MAVKRKKAVKVRASSRKYSDILYEVKDQVAWVTINRPRVLNSFREQTLDQMIDALKSTREDPSIVCAVVTGAGDKSFSAGGDFNYIKELSEDVDLRTKTIIDGREIVMGMVRCRIPVIAAVNGPAVGLGCSVVALYPSTQPCHG